MAIKSGKLTYKNIDAVLKYLPVFRQKDFMAGEWSEKNELEEGVFSFPVYNCNEQVNVFVKTLHKEGFIIDFDWPNWQDEAERFYSNPELLKTSDIGILQKLLTTHIRKERFCEGHLACMLSDGHICAILNRLKEVRKEMVDSQQEEN